MTSIAALSLMHTHILVVQLRIYYTILLIPPKKPTKPRNVLPLIQQGKVQYTYPIFKICLEYRKKILFCNKAVIT